MNRLSSTKMFQDVEKEFKAGSILRTLQTARKEAESGKYTVDLDLYDYMLKTMRTQYSFSLTRTIIQSAMNREVIPTLYIEGKDGKTGIQIPPILNTILSSNSKKCFVDISPVANYVRYPNGEIELLEVDSKKLYAYLHMGFVDLYCRKYEVLLDKAVVFNKTVAIAYGQLFTKCIDKTFPIKSSTQNANLSIAISAIFAMVNFFGYDYDTAKSVILSDRMFNRREIEASSNVLDSNVITSSFDDFLRIYGDEFPSLIKKNALNTRFVVGLWNKMYGGNAQFALVHSVSFLKMLTCPSIGFYQDFAIKKIVEKEIDTIEEQMLHIFTK